MTLNFEPETLTSSLPRRTHPDAIFIPTPIGRTSHQNYGATTPMTVSRNIRVFVADDSIVLRERLLEMLREIPGVEVLGCAGDGLHAISCIRDLKPDAVVLDIQMPCGNGLDVLKNIKHDKDGCPRDRVHEFSLPAVPQAGPGLRSGTFFRQDN